MLTVIFRYNAFLQVTWCGQVFNEPGTVLCTLISQTLVHLDPSLSSCITEFIKNESNIIGKLIELRQVRVHHYHIFLLLLSHSWDMRLQSYSATEPVLCLSLCFVPWLSNPFHFLQHHPPPAGFWPDSLSLPPPSWVHTKAKFCYPFMSIVSISYM